MADMISLVRIILEATSRQGRSANVTRALSTRLSPFSPNANRIDHTAKGAPRFRTELDGGDKTRARKLINRPSYLIQGDLATLSDDDLGGVY